MFYVLDASRLIDPKANLDEVFMRKLDKNLARPYHYGEAFRDKAASSS